MNHLNMHPNGLYADYAELSRLKLIMIFLGQIQDLMIFMKRLKKNWNVVFRKFKMKLLKMITCYILPRKFQEKL